MQLFVKLKQLGRRSPRCLVDVLNQLIDQIGSDEDHPLASLMEVIGVLIEKYEDEHVPELDDL